MLKERMFVFTLLVIIMGVFELYTYFGLKSTFQATRIGRYLPFLYIAQTIFVIYALYAAYSSIQEGAIMRSAKVNFWIGVIIIVFFTKLFYVAAMLLQDGGRFLAGVFNYGKSMITSDSASSFIPERRDFLNKAALILASIPFSSLLYGMTKGKYNYTVKNVKLKFKDLPKSFDGFKIVQISDIHSGSLDDKDAVKHGIDMINMENADLVLFTGDLINAEKDEINPFIDIFSKIEAKQGKYAILGNHDYYGFYRVPESNKAAYWNDLMHKFKLLNFDLLNNEHRVITKGDEKIYLTGVENWGAGRWFPKHGDFDKAIQGVPDDAFTILMSHDPTHWDHHIIDHPKHVHITLSGHTHGMQFGIDLPSFKWSPVKYRYKRWMGLYEEKDQYLYVNRGFGFLGFPGRVGMWPEITVIELVVA